MYRTRFDAGGFEKDRHIGNDEGPIKNQSIITEEPVIAADAGQHIYLLDNDLACVDSGDAVFSQFRILDDWRELSTFPDGTTERQSDANKNSIMLDAGRHYLPGSVALSAFSIDSSNANWNIKLNRSSANYECLFFNDASNEYTVIGSDDSRWQDEIDILADQKSREGSFVHGLAIGDTLWMVCMDLNEIVDGDFVAGRGEPVIVQATIP